MYRIEERIGSHWRPFPHAYSLDVAQHLAARTAACCPGRSVHRRRGYAVRVVELSSGTTVATYTDDVSPSTVAATAVVDP